MDLQMILDKATSVVREVAREAEERKPLRIFSGTITLTNTKTGEHRTFLVKKQQRDDHRFQPGKRLVGLLTGPNNYEDFHHFGVIDEAGAVRVWAKHRRPGKPTRWEWYAEMINVLIGGFEPKLGRRFESYEVLHETVCCRCGRKLTTPESIRLGIGPDCATR